MTRILVNGQEVLRLTRDSWEESKHPRASNGQFGHGSGKGASAALKSHSMYTKEDYEYLAGKGYSEAQIKAIWDRDKGLGKDPQHGNKHGAANQKLVAGVARAMGKGKDWRPELETSQVEAAKPLYAAFRLTQLSEDLLASWASSYGLSLPHQPHVTVAYSRAPVDARRLPQITAGMVIPPGGRSLEQFGDDVVLCVQCPDLDKVWQAYRDAGASWDYPSYRPHITIARWQKLESLKDVPAFDEPITLGPEWRDTLKEHWHTDVVEVAA